MTAVSARRTRWHTNTVCSHVHQVDVVYGFTDSLPSLIPPMVWWLRAAWPAAECRVMSAHWQTLLVDVMSCRLCTAFWAFEHNEYACTRYYTDHVWHAHYLTVSPVVLVCSLISHNDCAWLLTNVRNKDRATILINFSARPASKRVCIWCMCMWLRHPLRRSRLKGLYLDISVLWNEW